MIVPDRSQEERCRSVPYRPEEIITMPPKTKMERALQISEATYYGWRCEYGGMKVGTRPSG